MKNPEEHGIPFLDTSDCPDMSRREVRNMLETLDSGGRITPFEADRLLHADFQGSRHGDKITAGISAGLFAGYIATETAHKMQGEDFPEIATFPKVVDTALRVTYNLLPIGDVEVATAQVGDHAPMLVLATAIGYTGVELGRKALDYMNNGGIRGRARKAQEELTSNIEAGSVRWKIEEGSTVAFVGNGDPLARQIAKHKPGDIVQVAQQPVEEPWTLLPESATREQILDALDRADIGNAGELLFLPTKASQEFLPGEDDFELRIGRMAHYIGAADQYCDERGIERKPALVIGCRTQGEVLQTATHSDDENEEEVSLEQYMSRLAETREREIAILDPTDIIVDRIVEIADGCGVSYAGSKESAEVYKRRFFAAVRERAHIRNCDDEEKIRVFYGRKDFTTVNEATPDDIAVLLDPSQKEALLHKGMPPERILVVPEEVLKVAAPYIELDDTEQPGGFLAHMFDHSS